MRGLKRRICWRRSSVRRPFSSRICRARTPLTIFVEPFHQTEKRAFGRVRNVGEDRIFDVVVDAFENLRHEQRAEALAFAIDVPVAAPREVDAFERAGVDGARCRERFHLDAAVAADDQRVARFELLDVFVSQIERRLDHGTLGGRHDDFVVVVEVGGADAARIAHDERVAVSDHAGHRIAPVPAAGRERKDFLEVDMAGQQVGDFLFGISLVLEVAVFVVVLPVEEVSDAFQNRHRVGLGGRVLTQFDEFLIEFVDVRQVEVAGYHEAARHPVVLARDGVYVFDVVLAEGAVAQVAEEDFAGELDVLLHPFRIVELVRMTVRDGRNPVGDLLEDVLDRGVAVRTDTVDVDVAVFGIELDVGQPGTVLSPVVLFFHQQVHLVEPVEVRAVFLPVVVDRLEQPDEGNAAFVFYGIAHSGFR